MLITRWGNWISRYSCTEKRCHLEFNSGVFFFLAGRDFINTVGQTFCQFNLRTGCLVLNDFHDGWVVGGSGKVDILSRSSL